MTKSTLPSLPVTQSKPATDAPTNCAESTGSAQSLGEILGWPSGDKAQKPREPIDEMEIFKSAIWEYVMASQVNIPSDRVQNAWDELKRIADQYPPNNQGQTRSAANTEK